MDSMAAGQGFWERLLMYGGSFISVSCGTSGEKGRSTLLKGWAFIFCRYRNCSYFLLLLQSLYNWMATSSSHSFYSLEEFLY